MEDKRTPDQIATELALKGFKGLTPSVTEEKPKKDKEDKKSKK